MPGGGYVVSEYKGPRIRRIAPDARGCGAPPFAVGVVGPPPPPALARAAIAFDRGHGFGLVGAGPQAAGGCGSAIPGESCRVLDLGRPFR